MSSLAAKHLAIPKGSTVLMTGVNGFLTSHVANELLEYGYNVRGTVRGISKSTWIEEFFSKQYGQVRFTLLPLTDMTRPGAFEDAVQGVAALVHVASPLYWGPSGNTMVMTTVAGAINALHAAKRQSSVKRFVLTSSSVAAAFLKPEVEGIVVTEDSWNEEALASVQGLHSPSLEQGWFLYAASKTRAEQAVWEFYHKDQTPRSGLVVNTVLPSTDVSKSLDPVSQGHPSTSSFLQSLWNETNLERLRNIPPQYFIDVRDTARLHVAGAILCNVQGERIFAWAEPWNFDSILDILRRQSPSSSFIMTFTVLETCQRLKTRG